jgi:hypothetical protein
MAWGRLPGSRRPQLQTARSHFMHLSGRLFFSHAYRLRPPFWTAIQWRQTILDKKIQCTIQFYAESLFLVFLS